MNMLLLLVAAPAAQWPQCAVPPRHRRPARGGGRCRGSSSVVAGAGASARGHRSVAAYNSPLAELAKGIWRAGEAAGRAAGGVWGSVGAPITDRAGQLFQVVRRDARAGDERGSHSTPR